MGLIVVDEEHESAYKQGDDPRYDARRVAAKRARIEGAVLLLGSATPRPESWHRLPRATLPTRVGGDLPRVEIVDLRRDGLYPLSRPLRTGLIRLARQRPRQRIEAVAAQVDDLDARQMAADARRQLARGSRCQLSGRGVAVAQQRGGLSRASLPPRAGRRSAGRACL